MRASGCDIFGKAAVGADDQNAAQFVGIAGAHFVDARIVGARGFVGAIDQLDLGQHSASTDGSGTG